MGEMRYTLEYQVKRVTDYGTYTALVFVDQMKRGDNVHITLYVGEPVISGLFGLIKVENTPVRYLVCDTTTDINQAIEKMIIDYELALYQQERAEKASEYIEIDYEMELAKIEERKRREKERRKKEYEMLKLKYQQQEQDHHEPVITVWDEKLPQDQQEQEAEQKKRKYNLKSILNLKQYQHLKNEA